MNSIHDDNSITQPNRLVIAGTGIRFYGQITIEAKNHIEKAEKLLYLVNEPVTEEWLCRANHTAESLAPLYHQPGLRRPIYEQIAAYIVSVLDTGVNVCAVFYGHPGIFALPPHLAIRKARAAGYAAEMLPGVSAEDCLFADIGIDPGDRGCQSFEATDFLVRSRIWDPASHLILWQVGGVGNLTMEDDPKKPDRQKVLAGHLARQYPMDHRVAVYEASLYPSVPPRIEWCPLDQLHRTRTSNISTLYVPPLADREPDAGILEKLGHAPQG